MVHINPFPSAKLSATFNSIVVDIGPWYIGTASFTTNTLFNPVKKYKVVLNVFTVFQKFVKTKVNKKTYREIMLMVFSCLILVVLVLNDIKKHDIK